MDSTILYGRTRKKRVTEQASPTMLQPNISLGLSDNEVHSSRKKFGSNSFTQKPRHGFVYQFIRNLCDPIIRVLICGLIINIIFTYKNVNWIEAGGIALTVFVSTLVSTISEYSSGKAYDKLFACAEDRRYTVVRNGVKISLPSSELVCSDIIELSAGEILPCDGILISGDIGCDQSSLTGESETAKKHAIKDSASLLTEERLKSLSDPSNPSFLCRGASIVSGEGIMLITAVGDSTMYGAIASDLQEDGTPSPLKERLTVLAGTISRIGYICAALAAVAYLISSLIIADDGGAMMLDRLRDTHLVSSEVLHALTLAVSLVIVIVPEGLPMMITVVLSANMKLMMRRGVLVRRLVGIETAGSLSILFTDKTGTLTSGRMRVSSVSVNDMSFSSLGDMQGYKGLVDHISAGIVGCSGIGGGNQTDRAVSSFLPKYRNDNFECIRKLPFDSKNKYAASLIKDKRSGKLMTVVRGAPEIILSRCRSARCADGRITSYSHRMHPDGRGAALREVAQAYGGEECFDILAAGDIPAGLIHTCTFLISDELRESVAHAAAECASAGVQVVMLTGDSETTAESVARAAGIIKGKCATYTPGDSISDCRILLKGEVLHKLDDDELSLILPKLSVISRATPQDKSRLIRVARNCGHVVGMTGDGVNDAPALKAADVGFAMGSGTDAAREAGDVVITDNNFASIVNAILYGRTIFGSIRKFILFQLTMNVCAVGVSLLAPFFGIESPITITQMLWINIIMDTLGSLAFSGEAPLPEYMKTPPIARDEKILSSGMCRRIILGGLYTLSLSMFFLLSKRMHSIITGGETYYLTAFFALFVFCGIANSFCARTERLKLTAGLMKNRSFVSVMALTAAIQLLIIYFGKSVFRTVPLTLRDLVTTFILSLSVFPADFVFKIICSLKSSKKISKR